MGTAIKAFGQLSDGERNKLAYEILGRYCNGETVKDLARKYQATPPAIYKLLVSECLEDWKNSRAALSLERIEKGYADLEVIEATIADKEKCDNMLELSRQRELGKMAATKIDKEQWQLERTLKSVYGQHAPQSVPQTVTINIGIERPGEKPVTATIEAGKD